MQLQMISSTLYNQYLEHIPQGLDEAFEALHEAELTTEHFSFYTSVASVFSSKIEGEKIELDSYVRYKRDGILFQPDYTKKTDDLYNAYLFAQNHQLNEENLKQAHRLLSKNILSETWQGKYRNQNIYVATDDGKIEYVAVSPFLVKDEIAKLFHDIQLLQSSKLSIVEVFYYASMIHLVFVKIHPWSDGNGRTARLLEKWFIAEKLGEKAWYLQSEKMYYQQHQVYYNNLRALGLEYDYLDYQKALPFVLMLPKAFI
jgi:Fic family protein